MSQDRRLGLALFCFLLSLYLLTYSGRFHSSDGLAMFAVAGNLVRHGRVDIESIRWIAEQQGGFGPDGLAYASKGIMTSVVAVPLAWLGRQVPWWGEAHAALLLNPILTALCGWLLFAFVRRWGYRRRTAALTALLFGTATLAWPYTKTLFSEPLTGLALLGTAYFLLRYRDRGQVADVVGAGAALGVALLARPASVITWPSFGALLICYLYRRTPRAKSASLRTLLSPVFKVLIPFALFPALAALLVLAFNATRFGSPFQTGYTGVQRFSTPLWMGVAGLTISPGRSLFLYAPILLGGFVAVPRLWRRHRPELLLAGAILASYLLFYGRWFMWHGGVAWGTRTLVPTIPLLSLLLAPAVDGLRGRGARAFALLAVVSVAVQGIGVSVDFTLAQDALLRMNRHLFAPVTFFDPRYAQIWLQIHFIQLKNLDFAWMSGGTSDLPALGISLLILAASGLALGYLGRDAFSPVVWIGPVACVIGISLLLVRYRQLTPKAFRDLAAQVEGHGQPVQTVVLDDPVGSETFLDLYAGGGEIVGLNAGEGKLPPRGAAALQRIQARGGAFWVVSDGPARDRNAIDNTLRDRAFLVSDARYGNRRLTLYDIPRHPLVQVEQGELFGQTIRLQRASFTGRQQAGSVVLVSLSWRALYDITEDYQVFVHLVDAEGKIQAQQDGTPVDGRRPTTTWSVGEEIADRYAFLLPQFMPSGEYQIEVGLYRLPDGARLMTGRGTDHITLGPVSVAGS